MQKTLIIVLLVAVIVLAGVIVYQKLNPVSTTPTDVKQPVVNQPTENQSKEQIASNLFKDYYLESAKSSNRNISERLSDYRIDKITIEREEGSCFRFLVSYSVKPTDVSGMAWMAGDGTRTEDGWITGKGAIADAVKNNGTYIIREGSVGTGASSISCMGE